MTVSLFFCDLFPSGFTFGTDNLGIAEIRRRMADVFCFRLSEILVRVYKDELGGEALRKIIEGRGEWTVEQSSKAEKLESN